MRKGNGSLSQINKSQNEEPKEVIMKVKILSRYINTIEEEPLWEHTTDIPSEHELPEGKTREDIEYIDQKWISIGIHFKDGTCMDVWDDKKEDFFKYVDKDLYEEYGLDFKHPTSIFIVEDDGQFGKSWDGEGFPPMTIQEMLDTQNL